MKTVIVTGGRNYADVDRLWALLDEYRPSIVVCGDATGADALARNWAGVRQVSCRVYAADWKTHGRAAGPIRNRWMLEENRDADIVLAFPGGKGTANCVQQARELGMTVIEVAEVVDA